jgi:hypothetical protein
VDGLVFPRRHPSILFGDGGCIAPDTLIEGPELSERVDVLAERGQPITVWALGPNGRVAAQATAPMAKGYAALFQFTLSSGRSVTVTGRHRFLTPSGWRFAETLAIGDALSVSVSPAPVQTAHEESQSEFLSDAHRCQKIFQDSTDHCSEDSRPYDEQPLCALTGVREFPKQLSGAPLRIHSNWPSDFDCLSRECIPCSLLPRHSRSDSFPDVPLGEAVEFHAASSHARPHFESICTSGPSRLKSGHLTPSIESYRLADQEAGDQFEPSTIPPDSFYHDSISSISYINYAIYYDLTVPYYHNYLANGIWHHNSAKSYVSLFILGTLALAGLKVALFDWELSGEDHRDRLERLFGVNMPEIQYCRCERPLVHEFDRLRRITKQHKIDFAVYDSVAFACDGPPESAEIAGKYFRAVREIHCGSLHVAHINKSENADQRPFGSAFWHNGARMTWNVQSIPAAVDRAIHLGFYNRKANMGPLLPAVGMRVMFLPQRKTVIVPENIAETDELAAKLTVRERLIRILRETGPQYKRDLCDRIDPDTPDNIARVLRRYPNLFREHGDRIYLQEEAS